MANAKKQESQYEGFGYFYDRFTNWVQAMPSSKRKINFATGLLAVVVLSAAASFNLIDATWYIWVQTAIGLPAGIILFAILVGIYKTTKINEWKIFKFKENNSAAQRVRKMLVVIALVIIFFLLVSPFLSNYYGLGGALMTATALIIYNILRRTPEEIALAKQGIIDPRDIKNEEEEEE